MRFWWKYLNVSHIFWLTYCLDSIVLEHEKVFTVLKEMMSKSKQQKGKEKYYPGQYVNWTELARGSNMHKVASVFFIWVLFTQD